MMHMNPKKRHEKAMEPWRSTLFDIMMKMEKANQQLYEKQVYPETKSDYKDAVETCIEKDITSIMSDTIGNLQEVMPIYPIPYRKPQVIYTANAWEMLIIRRRGVSTCLILLILCLLQLFHIWIIPEAAHKLNIGKLVCICLLWMKFVRFVRSGKLKECWES